MSRWYVIAGIMGAAAGGCFAKAANIRDELRSKKRSPK